MRRCMSVLFLSTVLLVPMGKADEEHHPNRYYDRDRRDWHEWNENEDRAYRQFLEARHKEFHEFAKASRKEQQEYWKWRHIYREYDK